jgi:hypothetical protein
LQLPPPQSPNAITLSAAIAMAVAITHLFDIAIKWRWCGQWQRKCWLRQQGWWTSDGGQWQWRRQKMQDSDGNKVAGNKEGNGKSGKSNDDGDKEGNGIGGKGDGDGNKEGKGNGRRGQWQRWQERLQRQQTGPGQGRQEQWLPQ